MVFFSTPPYPYLREVRDSQSKARRISYEKKNNYRCAQSLQQFYTGGPYAVSSDGSFLVCACDDTIKIVDSANASIKSTIDGDSEPVTSLSLSQDNKFLFSASHSRQIRIWDVSSLKCLRSWKLMVKRTLVPSQEEAEEEFYQGMTPLDDVVDSRVDKSLDEDGIEESEEDEPSVPMHQPPRDRPSSSQDNNVVEVVRQEMRELESRLVRVINGRCDHIEAKLDRLLKLVGSGASQPQGGEFQSDKSGFHSETRRFHTYSPQHEDNIPEENKGREEDCVFKTAVEKSVNVEEQVTPIQGEGRRGSTGQGMLSNPSTAIVVYREMPRILIPDSKHRLGEQEPVDVVMSNQPEQSAESCPKDQVGESSTNLLEDETDEESPKGRGQRKRRKGKALRTPWTNPLKRRKFKNVTVYDPFREVDPAKVSDLKEWMEKASPRDAVALAICDAGEDIL
ncbi:WD REPEATS REGION domain-containing protein [Abeliophyllum distichum]|uniref:WD REPEATS REGION domain-containing protein n=1 Tax=Abeliophyllum distichum TaxID=126358 RepID=A0ABD1RE54_9LAMI